MTGHERAQLLFLLRRSGSLIEQNQRGEALTTVRQALAIVENTPPEAIQAARGADPGTGATAEDREATTLAERILAYR